MRHFLMIACCVLLALSFVHQGPCQTIRHRGCVVDAGFILVPQCAFERKNGQLYVSARYLHLVLGPSKDKLEPIAIEGSGWAYIDRRGLVVVQDVAFFDNGADFFHNGLVRVVRSGKYGLADMHGAIIVPEAYDGILDPDDGDTRWSACKGCRTVTAGEYHFFAGGDWYWFDKRGQVIGKRDNPAVPSTK
jgi:hypothetical protein